MSNCVRLKKIEAALPDVDGADAEWMVSQIRGWQTFAKRVVDFGDVVRKPNADAGEISKAYENVFAPVKGDK